MYIPKPPQNAERSSLANVHHTLRILVLSGLLAIGAQVRAQIVEQWRVDYNTPPHTTNGADDAGICVAHNAAGDIFAAGTTKDVRTGLDWVVRKYAAATGTLVWQKQFNGAGAAFDDEPRAIAVDPAGDVVVTGYTKQSLDNADIHTIKYSGVDGTVLWEANYNGPLNNDDEATGLALDAAGNPIVTGYIYVDGSNGFHDFYTVKYAAATGAVIWERKFDGAVHLDDKPNAVAVDPAGNVVVAGLSYGNGTNADYYTAKYAAADGSVLWEKRYSTVGTGTDIANAVACDAAGNVYVTGQSPMTNQGNDIYTAKYAAADGALLWEKRYDSGGGNPDIAVAEAVDAGGNVIVAGTSSFQGYVAKYAAATGALLWDRHYNGPITGNDAFQGLALDAAGNVSVTGYANYDGAGGHKDLYAAKYAAADGAVIWENIYNGPANNFDEGDGITVDADANVIVTGWSRNSTDQDCYTAKYAAATGALIWERREDGILNHSEQGHAVAVDAAGNVLMAGNAHNGSNTDLYAAKYTAGGALVWEQHYDAGFQGNDSGDFIGVDANGDVFVCGSSGTASGRPNFYTAKYAAATGAVIWQRRYGDSNGATPAALAVDASGNVLVAGTPFSATTNNDVYVAKYASADGSVLWEKRYGVNNTSERAAAMALDSAGNAIVAGSQSVNGNNDDFLTIKFASADGTQLWAKVYNAPPGRTDIAQAVAVDAAGNVIVTGFSGNAAGDDDYETVKFAGTDGSFIWERRYNGPAASTDHPSAIGVDAVGNVFVTGTSRGASSATAGNDIYTAKYAAADGALLWEKRYNGAGNSSDIGNALRVDGSGNVVVAGSVNRGPGQVDLYTAKYAAADGALLFETLVDGAGHGSDTLFSQNSLALKRDGYPVLTAISQFGASGDTDALTVLFSPPGPTVSNLAATGVTTSGVTFSASVNPNGLAATGTFDYRIAGSGTFTSGAPVNAGSGSVPMTRSQTVSGLAGHTAYEWRAVFTTATGITSINGPSFTTLNSTPVAIGDAIELPVTHFDAAANDTDADGDPLSVTGVGVAAHGTATLNSDHTVSYVPNATFAATDTFNYTVSDGFGGMATGTVTVTDTTPPIIDSVPPAQTIVTAGGPAPMPDLSGLAIFHDNSGFATFSQTPAAGTPLPLGETKATIKVTDHAGLMTTAGVTIHVVAPPTVATGAASGITLTSVTLNATVNPNKMATTAYFEFGSTGNYGSTTPAQNLGNGTVALPLTANLAGLTVHTAYHFRVVATNDTGTSQGGDAMFVTGDSNPVPVGDVMLVVTQPKTINPLINDTDPDGDALTVTASTNGARGTVVFSSNSVTYTPANLGNGTDVFAYTVSDGFGGSAQGTVKVYSVGAEAGFYAGLLDGLDNNVDGQAQITLGSTGKLTGRIDLHGIKYPFKGQVDENGGAAIQISRNDQARVTMLLQLLPGELPVFEVSILDRNGAVLGAGEAVRADTIMPGKLRYTMVFPPDPAQAGSDAIPQGTGYAVVTLSRAGKIGVIGQLGDGASFSAASSLRTDNTFPFYAGLYDLPRGQIYGTLTRRDVPGVSDLDGVLTWLKKQQIYAKPPQANGFTTTTAAFGSLYAAPMPTQLNGMLAYDAAGDATLTFVGGGLSAPVTGLARVGLLSPITALPPLTGLKCTVTDGRLSGAFTPSGSPSRKFHGVVLQKQNLGLGYFLTPTQSGTFTLTPTAAPPQ